jgi:hypothetical protein
MIIGTALNFAKKGQKVAVRLPNGKVKRFIAESDIVSTNVLIIGDPTGNQGRVISQDSPRSLLNRTTQFFQSKPNYEEGDCKLVSASLWTALKNVPIAPEEPGTTSPEIKLDLNYSKWFYSEGDHACIETTDGRGTYDTAGACMAANSGRFVTSFTPKEPYYFNSSNGNTYVSSESGYRLNDVTYQRTHEIFAVNASRNPGITDNNVWLVTDTQSYTFTDGSLIPNPASLGYTKTSRSVLDLGAPGNVATFKMITVYVKTIETANGDFEPLPTFRSNPSMVVGNHIAPSGIVIRRDVQPRPITSGRTINYFIKSHDPNLPPFLAYSRPEASNLVYRPYFIYLGNKAYLVFKIGKIPNPDVSFSARSWRQIKVIEVRIGGSSLQVVRETDYFDSEDNFAISSDAVLKSVVTRFTDNPENDPAEDVLDTYNRGEYCIRDGEYYLSQNAQSQFIEVSYQKKDGKIIEYKLPGVLRLID